MRYIILFFILSISFLSKSQDIGGFIISGAGDEYEKNKFSIAWTLGEPIVKTIEADGMTVTQGFHQTVFIISSIDEVVNTNLPSFKIYPNPASSFFFVEVEEGNSSIFDYPLTNIDGSLVEMGNFNQNQNRFDLSQLSNTTYFLTIIDKEKGFKKSFQIQKAQ